MLSIDSESARRAVAARRKIAQVETSSGIDTRRRNERCRGLLSSYVQEALATSE
jgi:hypothetical protein